jgi:hypothetical protein
MSLDTNVETSQKENKETNKNRMEQTAKEFSDLVWSRKKKKALDLYNSLDKEYQNYIRRNYRDDLKAAQMQF